MHPAVTWFVPLLIPPNLHSLQRVLMTYCEQNCQTSAGNGHLVLTTFRCVDSEHLQCSGLCVSRQLSPSPTFRLLVVVKGGTRTQCLLDLREPVMLEKFDMRHLLSSFPAITQRSNEDKQPGKHVCLVSVWCLSDVGLVCLVHV